MGSLRSKVLGIILGVTSSAGIAYAPTHYNKKELKIICGIVVGLIALGMIGIVLIEIFLT